MRILLEGIQHVFNKSRWTRYSCILIITFLILRPKKNSWKVLRPEWKTKNFSRWQNIAYIWIQKRELKNKNCFAKSSLFQQIHYRRVFFMNLHCKIKLHFTVVLFTKEEGEEIISKVQNLSHWVELMHNHFFGHPFTHRVIKDQYFFRKLLKKIS